MFISFNLERKQIDVVMRIDSIMRRECAIIVIINTVEQRSHGIASMKNCMRVGCVKTVI